MTHQFQQKSFNTPDENMNIDLAKAQIVDIGGGKVGHVVLQPGWKWSNDIKPIAKTESCLAPHFQYQVSGKMHVVMDDGTEFDTNAGDVLLIPPGHDAWVVGDEPVEAIDWGGAHIWAKPID